MGSGSATGKKIQVRLVHSLLKYFLKFQLWYWIKNLHYQIFKFVIDNSDISLNCLQHIQKRRNFDAKVTCHQPICLLLQLHAILRLSGVGLGVSWPLTQWLCRCDDIHVHHNSHHSVHTYTVSGPWMDHILHLVCIWGWYFLAAHTHVLCMGSGRATGFFSGAEISGIAIDFSAFSAKIFFQISVVILTIIGCLKIIEFNFTLPNIWIWY